MEVKAWPGILKELQLNLEVRPQSSGMLLRRLKEKLAKPKVNLVRLIKHLSLNQEMQSFLYKSRVR